jgi:hypothetical protein
MSEVLEKRLQATHHFDWYVASELSWEDPWKPGEKADQEEKKTQWKETKVSGPGEQILINALREIVQDKTGRGIILLASRGSGKTVASYRCEHLLANASTSRVIFGGSRPLVFRWAKSNWPTTTADNLIDFVAADFKLNEFLKKESSLRDASQLCRSVVEYAIEEKRLVIIVDAYDELEDKQKDSLRAVHARSLEEGKKVLWIITSRDYAVHEEKNRFFKEDIFRRLRLQPFSRELQNRLMERALNPMVNSWREDCFKDSAEDWDKELGTPLTLRQVAVMINESTSKGLPLPSFSSLSDLFVQSSDRLIDRELNDRNLSPEKLKIDGNPLAPSLLREFLERALGAIAFELAVRGIWKEVVGTTDLITEIIVKARARFLKGFVESNLNVWCKPESAWDWAFRRTGEFEINNGVYQADINQNVLSYTTRHVQEMRCARFLSKFATAIDLRDAAKPNHCALGHNGEEDWTDIWKGVIKMPVNASDEKESSSYLEALKVLFERPTNTNQRRPTKLMWEAQEWLGQRAGLKNLIPTLHAHLVSQFQSIKQQAQYQPAIKELLDPARYVLLRCGDEPVLDKDTGVFTMGPDLLYKNRTVRVTLTQRFGICKYQFTEEQLSIWDNLWSNLPPTPIQLVLEAIRPRIKESNLPATDISWLDCYFMLVGLSGEHVKLSDGREYKFGFLTEAQWEYACRAGSTTAYGFGDDGRKLSKYAWYYKNSDRRVHPVGSKKPNGWGLYDMHGNVFEWCCGYEVYSDKSATDPLGLDDGYFPMLRGGFWLNKAAECRSAYREFSTPLDRDDRSGFRLALRSSGIPKSPEADKWSGATGGRRHTRSRRADAP